MDAKFEAKVGVKVSAKMGGNWDVKKWMQTWMQ